MIYDIINISIGICIPFFFYFGYYVSRKVRAYVYANTNLSETLLEKRKKTPISRLECAEKVLKLDISDETILTDWGSLSYTILKNVRETVDEHNILNVYEFHLDIPNKRVLVKYYK